MTETCKSSIILENFIEVLEQSLHKLSPETEQIIVRDFNVYRKTSHPLLIQYSQYNEYD